MILWELSVRIVTDESDINLINFFFITVGQAKNKRRAVFDKAIGVSKLECSFLVKFSCLSKI
jgi:hypothetical protein